MHGNDLPVGPFKHTLATHIDSLRVFSIQFITMHFLLIHIFVYFMIHIHIHFFFFYHLSGLIRSPCDNQTENMKTKRKKKKHAVFVCFLHIVCCVLTYCGLTSKRRQIWCLRFNDDGGERKNREKKSKYVVWIIRWGHQWSDAAGFVARE